MQIFEDFFQKKGEKPQVNSQKKNTTGGKQQKMEERGRGRNIVRAMMREKCTEGAWKRERKEIERTVWHGICGNEIIKDNY